MTKITRESHRLQVYRYDDELIATFSETATVDVVEGGVLVVIGSDGQIHGFKDWSGFYTEDKE